MSEQNNSMTLVDHLAELRHRLVIIFVSNLGLAMVLFQFADKMMAYLLALNPGFTFIFVEPQELFMVYIQLALLLSVIICSPLTIYQLWAFISKGLYARERFYGICSLVAGVGFFALGVVFCYKIALPFTLRFFVTITIDAISPMISIQSFASFCNTMLAAFGLVFEMPVLSFLFTKLGVITAQGLRKKQGLLILIIFILAAIITPPDVVSQVCLGVPMVLLLQISIAVSAFAQKGLKKEAAEAAA